MRLLHNKAKDQQRTVFSSFGSSWFTSVAHTLQQPFSALSLDLLTLRATKICITGNLRKDVNYSEDFLLVDYLLTTHGRTDQCFECTTSETFSNIQKGLLVPAFVPLLLPLSLPKVYLSLSLSVCLNVLCLFYCLSSFHCPRHFSVHRRLFSVYASLRLSVIAYVCLCLSPPLWLSLFLALSHWVATHAVHEIWLHQRMVVLTSSSSYNTLCFYIWSSWSSSTASTCDHRLLRCYIRRRSIFAVSCIRHLPRIGFEIDLNCANKQVRVSRLRRAWPELPANATAYFWSLNLRNCSSLKRPKADQWTVSSVFDHFLKPGAVRG